MPPSGQALIDEAIFLNDVSPAFSSPSGNRFDPYSNTIVATNIRRRRPLLGGTVPKMLDLIEGTRTNICRLSQNFASAPWVSAGVGVVSGVGGAPDGSLFATSATSLGVVGNRSLSQPITVGSFTPRTFSVYVKAGTASTLALGLFAGAVFRPVTGKVLSGPGAITGTNLMSVSGLSATEWTRVAISMAPTADTVLTPFLYPGGNGTHTNGVYLWGAQLEQATFASTVTFTGLGPTTRIRDNLVVNLSGLAGGGLSASDGTVLAVGVPEGRDTPAGPYSLSHSGNTNFIMEFVGDNVSGWYRSAVVQTTETETHRQMKSYGMTWDATNLRYYRNGVAAGTDVANAPSVVASTPIGHQPGGLREYYGYVGLLYWPRVLSPTELALVHAVLAL